ncbi:hypothetical protein B0T11DRAFT_55397 [Plectosphaerella cucumerina]|jgi:hypothetical protein|uniref:Uncharacterized protein n=1 Tax=Plectosphaerella cucumerina TaxID=40658 RepID=A0A8K0THE5_9PEZI|nr:hypothetical protein B0T11DRAFT_55397 [Plectosphaerella cucumerina]
MLSRTVRTSLDRSLAWWLASPGVVLIEPPPDPTRMAGEEHSGDTGRQARGTGKHENGQGHEKPCQLAPLIVQTGAVRRGSGRRDTPGAAHNALHKCSRFRLTDHPLACCYHAPRTTQPSNPQTERGGSVQSGRRLARSSPTSEPRRCYPPFCLASMGPDHRVRSELQRSSQRRAPRPGKLSTGATHRPVSAALRVWCLAHLLTRPGFLFFSWRRCRQPPDRHSTANFDHGH